MSKYKLRKLQKFKKVKYFVSHKFYSVLIFVGFYFRHLANISSLSTYEIFANKVYSRTLCGWSKTPTAGSLLKFHEVEIRRIHLLQNIRAASSLAIRI